MGTGEATAQLIKIPSDEELRVTAGPLLPSVDFSFVLSDRCLVTALATSVRSMKLLNTEPQKNPRPLVLTNAETEVRKPWMCL